MLRNEHMVDGLAASPHSREGLFVSLLLRQFGSIDEVQKTIILV